MYLASFKAQCILSLLGALYMASHLSLDMNSPADILHACHLSLQNFLSVNLASHTGNLPCFLRMCQSLIAADSGSYNFLKPAILKSQMHVFNKTFFKNDK